MSGRSGSALRGSLITQAVVTALFSLVPGLGTDSTWLVVQLALAAGAGGAAWLVGQPGSSARTVTLGYEGVALAAGVVGLLGHHYIPGTIIGVRVLVGALSHREPAPATEPATEPVVEPVAEPTLVTQVAAPQEAPALAAVAAVPAPAPAVAAAAPPAPCPAAEPAADRPPAPAPVPPPPRPAVAPIGVAAVDVLPARKGRR
ncbi:MAG: hypothetical protein ACJ74O_15565 [Frankiaceae bacterium]